MRQSVVLVVKASRASRLAGLCGVPCWATDTRSGANGSREWMPLRRRANVQSRHGSPPFAGETVG